MNLGMGGPEIYSPLEGPLSRALLAPKGLAGKVWASGPKVNKKEGPKAFSPNLPTW